MTGRAELRALYEDATAGLSRGDREVIELELRQGLEEGEVATVLGVSRGRAGALLSLAGEHLEACLGVLLVGRAGRDDCGELGTLLAGWDGRLTVLLRARVQRHIERCATCTARRAFELRPARLRDLSPGAALAAGAAESFSLAVGAPPALRAATIALASGHDPGARAHSAAVLARSGAFGRQGFPERARAAGGLPGSHGAPPGSPCTRPGGAAAAVAVLLALFAAAIAMALAGDAEHDQSAGTRPPVTRPGPAWPAALPARPRPSPASPSRGAALPLAVPAAMARGRMGDTTPMSTRRRTTTPL